MKFKITTRIPVSLLLAFCMLMMPIVAVAKKGDKNFKQGIKYEQAQQWEKAAQEFTLALAADPSNVDYQLHFRRATFNASQSFMQQGRALAEQRDFVGAYNAFRQAYGYDPVNELAVSEMERMLHLQRVKEGQNSGSTPAKTGEPQQGTLGAQNGQAQEATPPPARSPEVLRVVSFSGDLKSYIRTLAEQLNLNVIFDRQSFVQPKTIDINLRDVTTSQALDYIFLQEGLFFQKLSRRTIVVADQTRRPQYQQLVLRTFFLANSEPEKAKILIGQAIPPSVGRPQTIVVADKDTNSLTVRDTAENVRLIGELLQSIDKDRAEVVMDVNIYEVSKSDLMQFGNQFGSDTTLANLGGVQRGFSLLAGGAHTVGLPVSLGAALIFPSSQIQALQSKNNTKLIASTQVHAFNGEESTARIGQRVPVQTAQAYPFGVQTGTTTNTNTGFPSGGFPVINYEPTGLTLKFTPQVFPNHDVQVKMSIESKDVLGAGTLTPTFTERTITGTARVQNNRTMMLASVSQDVHTTGRRGLPILGLIPVLGRIFTAPTRDDRRIDIVIAVTPRVLRAPAITPRDEEMRPSGTLQSPTTGSLEAMLRESDREEQLAEWRLQQQNAAAARTAAAKAAVVPATVAVNPAPVPVQTVAADAGVTKDAAKELAGPAATAVAQPVPQSTQATLTSATNAGGNIGTEEAAFVPAPKSLVSNRSAAELAAVNTNPNTNGEAKAVLTSLSESNATSAVPSAIRSSIGRTAQLMLTAGDESMQVLNVGEKRRFALELKSDVSLAMAVLALRFDPKVVKINSVTPGSMLAKTDATSALPSLAQSIDPTGVCFISISSLNGAAAIKGTGTLVFIEIEGVGVGDAALAFENGAMHLVATDARDVTLEAVAARATVKQ
ncbi:MAG TPA: secretin N-terminal domain-containing protein [Pyrinomonadaceae bacterium]|nr:secretin N-terminal domain-containing protein [Pyrinomonadaceae bacterium]